MSNYVNGNQWCVIDAVWVTVIGRQSWAVRAETPLHRGDGQVMIRAWGEGTVGQRQALGEREAIERTSEQKPAMQCAGCRKIMSADTPEHCRAAEV